MNNTAAVRMGTAKIKLNRKENKKNHRDCSADFCCIVFHLSGRSAS